MNFRQEFEFNIFRWHKLKPCTVRAAKCNGFFAEVTFLVVQNSKFSFSMMQRDFLLKFSWTSSLMMKFVKIYVYMKIHRHSWIFKIYALTLNDGTSMMLYEFLINVPSFKPFSDCSVVLQDCNKVTRNKIYCIAFPRCIRLSKSDFIDFVWFFEMFHDVILRARESSIKIILNTFSWGHATLVPGITYVVHLHTSSRKIFYYEMSRMCWFDWYRKFTCLPPLSRISSDAKNRSLSLFL